MRRNLKIVLKSLSILLQDWLRYEITSERLGYLKIKNRMEKLGTGPKSDCYVCLWPYTSKLSAVEIWPAVGRVIMRKAIRDNEFRLGEPKRNDGDVDISVIIGHRGLERIELLLATLNTIGAQKDVNIECIVVEQDNRRKIEAYLPTWVRYIFQESNGGKEGYNRSAAFNLGAKNARGGLLLLHDNDMLVPAFYCHDLVSLAKEGYDVLNIKRFVFYLNRLDTQRVIRSIDNLSLCTPLSVVQNLEAGGSVAIKRNAYISIGGMDENFVGWGGEDNELWKRCSILKRWIWGYAPIIHLWHEGQPLKGDRENLNVNRAKALENSIIQERISRLRSENRM